MTDRMSKSEYEWWEEIRAATDSPAYRVELLRRYLRSRPGDGRAWASLGIELSELSRFDEAQDALDRALASGEEGHRRRTYCLLGRMCQYKGAFAEAEAWFRKAIALEPEEATGYIYLGAMCARLGRLAEAEQLHRQATGCETGCVDEAYHNLGLVLRAQGRYEEAVECFELALAIDPDYEVERDASQDVVKALRARAEANEDGS
jgi:Flp pilus assembly protein TadD